MIRLAAWVLAPCAGCGPALLSWGRGADTDWARAGNQPAVGYPQQGESHLQALLAPAQRLGRSWEIALKGFCRCQCTFPSQALLGI